MSVATSSAKTNRKMSGKPPAASSLALEAAYMECGRGGVVMRERRRQTHGGAAGSRWRNGPIGLEWRRHSRRRWDRRLVSRGFPAPGGTCGESRPPVAPTARRGARSHRSRGAQNRVVRHDPPANAPGASAARQPKHKQAPSARGGGGADRSPVLRRSTRLAGVRPALRRRPAGPPR